DVIGNLGNGLLFNGASSNTVGGAAGLGNVLSGNGADGLDVINGGKNLIQGNWVGTDGSGQLELPNQGNGLLLSGSSSNTIGGSAGLGNVLSGNAGDGLDITNGSRNLVQGN